MKVISLPGGIIDILVASGVSILSWVALRILTQGKLEYFLDKKAKLEQFEGNFSEMPHLDEDNSGSVDYERVYRLATLSHLRKDKDFFDRTFMAIFLFQCLRATGFLPMAQNRHIEDAQNITEEEIFIASLILRHLQLLQFNAHEIHEFVYVQFNGAFLELSITFFFLIESQASEKSMKTTKTLYIGVGIYPVKEQKKNF